MESLLCWIKTARWLFLLFRLRQENRFDFGLESKISIGLDEYKSLENLFAWLLEHEKRAVIQLPGNTALLILSHYININRLALRAIHS